MHYIVAPTHIRATHYAAALGLSREAWRGVSTPIPGATGTFHVLPGVSPAMTAWARFCASKTDGLVIDHG